MTEEEAEQWVIDRFGRVAHGRLATLLGLVVAEARHQNLVAPSTLTKMWSRHLVDSAQLFTMAASDGLWIDIGTGAGFPGLVIASLRPAPILLVEPRKRRAAFLAYCGEVLGIGSHTEVAVSRVEGVAGQAAVISARAVAPVARLLDAARHCATRDTQWVLPKGQGAREEIATAKQAWHGVFHVERSVTDPTSHIVVAAGIHPR